MADNILEVRNLSKHFKAKHGALHALDGVNFTLERGKTLGIVGESGCGKSTIGRTILRLIEPTCGEIVFNGVDITGLSHRQMRELRPKMQIIFQDPYSSLNPRRTVSQTIREPIMLNRMIRDKRQLDMRVAELMDMVGLAERFVNSYPHELDGGRRQRIGIARALSVNPEFIVCDEPVSALDVSIQAQILNLLKELQNKMGLSYIFITHNLSVVNYFSTDIAVMYMGRMVEKASVEELFGAPTHPYTRALLSAVPVPEYHEEKRKRIILRGEVTSPVNLPDECRFAKRCTRVCAQCLEGEPPLTQTRPGHFVACRNP
ncbi:MAG: Oligopeptide transport ATP-binding protein OppF [Firmicutes bacterium ADurb.Bin248]|nr:MAG: Oligopeptide transport ATP-binding protein OppF [Firmicutes bacterium ADurb.Bin248]HOG01506.1 ABC transporter ATP-binding protein [Clostridia bacterium]